MSNDARRLLIGGKIITSPGTGERKIKVGEFLERFYRPPTGGAWSGDRVVVIRGVELGRRAAAGSCKRRAREEFADWEPRRLRKSWGFSGAWKQESGRNTGGPGRHTGNPGAGRELGNPRRNEEEARELARCK